MVAMTYRQLALGWRPESERDHKFNVIALFVLSGFLLLGVILSSIPVPKDERVLRPAVPERVARFITEKPKPKPQPPAETKPQPPPPPPAETRIERPKPEERKPLTQAEEQARKRVQDKGLMALANDLAALADSSGISAMASQRVTTGSNTQAATVDTGILTAEGGRRGGSGGVRAGAHSGAVGTTQLDDNPAARTQGLLANQGDVRSTTGRDASRGSGRGRSGRAEEDVAVVMDRHKSILHSIYNRARRSNPGLKGKIVLVITIQPSGQVSNIVIKSSELNAPELEASLLARIRQFDFGASEGGPLTVTVPVEFLPS